MKEEKKNDEEFDWPRSYNRKIIDEEDQMLRSVLYIEANKYKNRKVPCEPNGKAMVICFSFFFFFSFFIVWFNDEKKKNDQFV